MIFIVLSSLETVHNTVQYRCCIFSLLYRLLRIRLKRQYPLLSYALKRKYTVNVQCGVQYTLSLHLMLVLSYCEQFINQTLPYLCMLHEYHVIYGVRYYPRFHVTAVHLGTYCTRLRGSACISHCTVTKT